MRFGRKTGHLINLVMLLSRVQWSNADFKIKQQMGSTWTSTISIVLARKVNETASRCLCLTFQPDFKNDIKCIRYVLYCEMLESHFHTAAWMLLLVLLPDDFIYGILNVCKDKKKKKKKLNHSYLSLLKLISLHQRKWKVIVIHCIKCYASKEKILLISKVINLK
jgi:hypothetical protein